MGHSFCAVLACGLTAAMAGAVWSAEGIAACHGEAEDDARLACYDLHTGFAPSNPEAAPPDDPGGKQWLLSQETSNLDSRKDVWLSVSSDNTQPNQIGRPEHARLWVRCMNNSTNVFVTFNDYTPDNQNVRYKLDDGPVRKKWMVHMQGGEGVGLWSGKSAIPFARGLFDQNTLVVAYNSYNNFNLEFVFDVSGLRARIGPLAQSCGWTP